MFIFHDYKNVSVKSNLATLKLKTDIGKTNDINKKQRVLFLIVLAISWCEEKRIPKSAGKETTQFYT